MAKIQIFSTPNWIQKFPFAGRFCGGVMQYVWQTKSVAQGSNYSSAWTIRSNSWVFFLAKRRRIRIKIEFVNMKRQWDRNKCIQRERFTLKKSLCPNKCAWKQSASSRKWQLFYVPWIDNMCCSRDFSDYIKAVIMSDVVFTCTLTVWLSTHDHHTAIQFWILFYQDLVGNIKIISYKIEFPFSTRNMSSVW